MKFIDMKKMFVRIDSSRRCRFGKNNCFNPLHLCIEQCLSGFDGPNEILAVNIMSHLLKMHEVRITCCLLIGNMNKRRMKTLDNINGSISVIIEPCNNPKGCNF